MKNNNVNVSPVNTHTATTPVASRRAVPFFAGSPSEAVHLK